jgi:uncharacterized protein YjdB
MIKRLLILSLMVVWAPSVIAQTTITVTPSTATVAVNQMVQLQATCNGADCTKTVLWASQAPMMASVTGDGLVTGRKSGSTHIIATFIMATAVTQQAAATVTVK